MRKKINIIYLVLIPLVLVFVSCGKDTIESKEINISVAASLTEPMTEIANKYSEVNDVKININSAGSGTLKKQISQGAEVGIFFSANEGYIDELINEGLINKEKKINPIANQLVLIKNNNSKINIKKISDLKDVEIKIALGDINTVPVGKYAKQSLVNENIWNDLQDNIIYCNGVTAVKAYVERGEVDYGIVYKSDSINLKDSIVEIEIPNNTHEKIIYSLAPIEGYKYEEECYEIIEYINSNEGKEILKKYGFTIME